MSYRVDPHAETPPSRQLVDAVLDAIARGDLGCDDRLPSVRAMAAEALVNPNTVSKAYRELEHLGVSRSRNGSGVFVTEAGVHKARALRLEQTLAQLHKAAAAALAAGHRPDTLREVLDRAADPAPGTVKGRKGA